MNEFSIKEAINVTNANPVDIIRIKFILHNNKSEISSFVSNTDPSSNDMD